MIRHESLLGYLLVHVTTCTPHRARAMGRGSRFWIPIGCWDRRRRKKKKKEEEERRRKKKLEAEKREEKGKRKKKICTMKIRTVLESESLGLSSSPSRMTRPRAPPYRSLKSSSSWYQIFTGTRSYLKRNGPDLEYGLKKKEEKRKETKRKES